jgi:tRNA threonylcarbamoyladenosine biosynthesis protein TsaE
MEFNIKSIQQIDETANNFATLFTDHRIFAFYGEMGAGKTSFIKALCKQLEVKGQCMQSDICPGL